jgi:Lon protease-like protein
MDILMSLYPVELTERSTQAMLENRAGIDGLDTPIFVCTPSLPYVPEYLRIFEPRYRLMLRRCLEGNRRFGMVWQNPHNLPGEEHRYNRVGTMLEITECRWEQSGEANIICVGLHKFIVNRCGWRDEYVVADVERYEDFSVSEESDYERSELALYSSHPQFQFFLEAQSTEALMQRALAELRACFQRNRDLARWINNSMGSPPTDTRAMGYYIATIFNPHNPRDPRHNLLKCGLLQERSPRVRLKTMLYWFYQSPWYLQGSPVISTTGYVSYVIVFVAMLLFWLIQ